MGNAKLKGDKGDDTEQNGQDCLLRNLLINEYKSITRRALQLHRSKRSFLSLDPLTVELLYT